MKIMKLHEKILILGACENPNRIGFLATKYLHNKGFNVFPVNHKKAYVDGIELHDTSEDIKQADVVTIFLNPIRQKPLYDYIFSLNPKKNIFNPGTENDELACLAQLRNINVIKGCTIALFSNNLMA